MDAILREGRRPAAADVGPERAAIDRGRDRYILNEGVEVTIKAVLRNGVIQPIDPLPPDWADGQELIVEEPQPSSASDIADWSTELDAATARIPDDEHDRFLQALDQIERESKEAVRKQWGRP
jgi:hypothetical protein